ncbi:MAG TPA: amidophosphoribosyltransferase [Candidatus Saccharimonadales bacterium]|nr:amidophosphoribosyltransferase [Candidatus Saccharimonadales bacterium]
MQDSFGGLLEPSDRLGEKCGVIAAASASGEAARIVYYGLWALQHRGQESSGITASDSRSLYHHSGIGLVSQAYREDDLAKLPGTLAIGHNRYSTSGEKDLTQPILRSKAGFALAHNGNLPSVAALQAFLVDRGINIRGHNDSELMADSIEYYLSEGHDLASAVRASYPLFTGAFSCVAVAPGQIVAFRDPMGIRPLALGKLSDGFVVASESCAFDTIGAGFLREVAPGEMIMINKDGYDSDQLVEGQQRLDIFELVYFARPDSLILGKRVNEVRRRMGINLAREVKVKADVIIPVPDSAIPAALGIAAETGIPFDHGLIKNRYIHRTFIRPAQSQRERDLQMKLNPLPEAIMGRSVAVVDDSIVRGTTTKKLVQMLYGAGAREVHVLISSPPVRYPDFYGIDTPKQSELIAANHTIEEVCQIIGADSLNFLSYDGMINATGLPVTKFSTACFNGEYPIDILERTKEVRRPVAV